MKAAAPDQIKWEDLREVPLSGLEPGDRWITLAPMTVCWVSVDGRIRGHFYAEPKGTVWTLQSWDGDAVTAVSDDGDSRTQTIPDNVKVNRIISAAHPGGGS